MLRGTNVQTVVEHKNDVDVLHWRFHDFLPVHHVGMVDLSVVLSCSLGLYSSSYLLARCFSW
jgi:hypothetical protein